MKKYSLTPEHKEQLGPWAQKWIENAMSTKSMDENEKEICRKAVVGLYESAGLTPPPLNRIVFVPSPFVLRFAGGFAAAIWHRRKGAGTGAATRVATDDATIVATDDATLSATDDAARVATLVATRDATFDATDAATRDATCAAIDDAIDTATRDATFDATDAATRDATCAAIGDAIDNATDAATRAAIDAATAATLAATHDAARVATDAAVEDATYTATDAVSGTNWFNLNIEKVKELEKTFNIENFGIKCAQESWRMWQGGNQWSAYASFLSFFRHVAKLDIDYSKWDHWEKLALHSGPRVVHKEFCIISDRPEILKVDSQNRPHCFDGPFCRWRDGSELYMIHGVRVPQWVVYTKPENFTKEMILNEKNADVRRCIIQKIGNQRMVELLNPTILDAKTFTLKSGQVLKYQLLGVDFGDKTQRPYLQMENPTLKGVVHIEGVKPDCKTVEDAICYRNGLDKFELPEMIS